MTTRTTMRGHAMPGGRVEYHGDLTPPTSTYAASIATSSVGRRINIAGSTLADGAPVVHRRPRRGKRGLYHFVFRGGRAMKPPVPGAPAYGSVINSVWQRFQAVMIPWQINPSWHEAGYPGINLGLSQRAYQPQPSPTGGPGSAQMQPRPFFDKVQRVPRARATIRFYDTRGAGYK